MRWYPLCGAEGIHVRSAIDFHNQEALMPLLTTISWEGSGHMPEVMGDEGVCDHLSNLTTFLLEELIFSLC